MVPWLLRGLIILWALFFALFAVRGIFNPAVFADNVGLLLSAPATNTIRADLGSFFLVAAGGAALGALVPGWTRALLIPAALFGTALLVRLFGMVQGDDMSLGITQAMLIEALTAVLMIGSWWFLSRSGTVSPPAPEPGEAG